LHKAIEEDGDVRVRSYLRDLGDILQDLAEKTGNHTTYTRIAAARARVDL
jgi:hypothetical protein